jgi:hypothetical protein
MGVFINHQQVYFIQRNGIYLIVHVSSWFMGLGMLFRGLCAGHVFSWFMGRVYVFVI